MDFIIYIQPIATSGNMINAIIHVSFLADLGYSV